MLSCPVCLSPKIIPPNKNIVPPHIMPFDFGEDSFNSGDNTAVNCMIVKGDLPLQIHWTLNGEPIVNEANSMHVVRLSPRLSSLSIEGINGAHRGTFRCIASNLAGRAEASSDLKVNGT